jgi:hypothetical protein
MEVCLRELIWRSVGRDSLASRMHHLAVITAYARWYFRIAAKPTCTGIVSRCTEASSPRVCLRAFTPLEVCREPPNECL